MSFTNNCKQDRIPGLIKGNPLQGLNEKVCIQVKKVFDACMKQETLQDVPVSIINSIPAISTLVPPFKFISAKSTTTHACIDNLIISELPDGNNCARVSGIVKTPLQVIFVDSKCTQAVGTAIFCIEKDVLLHTSTPSVIPYEIEAVSSIVCPEGRFIDETTLIVSACTTIILKVVMEVELLVPSYGYCYIPQCQEFTSEICDGIFDLPLFPAEFICDNRCGR